MVNVIKAQVKLGESGMLLLSTFRWLSYFPMLKLSFFLGICLLSHVVLGQTIVSAVEFDNKLIDTFSFATGWAFDWRISKDDKGQFSITEGESIKPEDTAHLYFTANCTTNVQGGYTIRYCYADKSKDTLKLTLSDGAPAYASTLYLYVVADSFYFKPKTVYPRYVRGQKLSYEITKQHLTLNTSDYKAGEIIMGSFNVEFTETSTVQNIQTNKLHLYFRGFIRTRIRDLAGEKQ